MVVTVNNSIFMTAMILIHTTLQMVVRSMVTVVKAVNITSTRKATNVKIMEMELQNMVYKLIMFWAQNLGAIEVKQAVASFSKIEH